MKCAVFFVLARACSAKRHRRARPVSLVFESCAEVSASLMDSSWLSLYLTLPLNLLFGSRSILSEEEGKRDERLESLLAFLTHLISSRFSSLHLRQLSEEQSKSLRAVCTPSTLRPRLLHHEKLRAGEKPSHSRQPPHLLRMLQGSRRWYRAACSVLQRMSNRHLVSRRDKCVARTS